MSCNIIKKDTVLALFKIDLKKIPTDLYQAGLILGHVELILNNYISGHPFDNGEPFGKLYFDEYSRQFEFSPAEYSQKRKLFQDEEENTPANLMLRSMKKNMTTNKTVEKPTVEKVIKKTEPKRRIRRKPVVLYLNL
ncbi:hypothetical protein N8987_01725 [Crocinitomix sp.]|nr:hypothetical protein [Crocinitomix sp.]